MQNPETHRDPSLAERDPEIARLIREEEVRETVKLRLIPSENYVSRAVLEATGSILTNKYSEGYAGKRYYEGQQNIDPIDAVDTHLELKIPNRRRHLLFPRSYSQLPLVSKGLLSPSTAAHPHAG